MRRHKTNKIYSIILAALFLSAFFILARPAQASTILDGTGNTGEIQSSLSAPYNYTCPYNPNNGMECQAGAYRPIYFLGSQPNYFPQDSAYTNSTGKLSKITVRVGLVGADTTGTIKMQAIAEEIGNPFNAIYPESNSIDISALASSEHGTAYTEVTFVFTADDTVDFSSYSILAIGIISAGHLTGYNDLIYDFAVNDENTPTYWLGYNSYANHHTVPYLKIEDDAGDGGGDSGSNPLPTINLSADPTSVVSGESASISWTSTDATSCDVDNHDGTSGSFSTGSLIATTEYSGTCTGSGGSASGTATVTVEEASPPEVRLTPDPVIIIPGILGSEQKDSVWIIDPILHTYDNLIETLKDNGYRENYDLFTFPYDWRKSNVETAAALKQKIDEVKHLCACDKVDLVAHSMGGLVARQYIESDQYNNDVDQLIFLGTPHLGAGKGYLAWEGGELDNTIGDQILKFILTREGRKQGFLSLVSYVRAKIPSVQQLLPVFDYLKDKNTGLIRTYPQNYPVNSFLTELNQNSDKLLSSGVNIINIVGKTGEDGTIRYVRVVDPPTPLIWGNGYPEGFLEKIGDRGLERAEGDQTVLLNSAEYIFNDSIVFDSAHSSLPTKAEGEIFRDLTNTEPSVLSNEFNFPNLKLLILKMLSPADMMVIAPDGKKIGKDFTTGQEINEISDAFYSGFETDDEFITIPNPLDGNYQVKTQGTGDGGEYTVASGYITDNNIVEKEVVGNIQPGLTQNIDLVVNNNNPEDLSIGFPVPPPPNFPSSGGGGGSYTEPIALVPKPEIPKPNEPGKILGKAINNIIKDSVLVLDSTDNRTVYIIGNNSKKFGFTSETVFKKLGYSFDNAVRGDLFEYQLGGLIESADAPHPNGSLVFKNGAIWYINNNKRLAFPSMAVFSSYGYNTNQVVPMNESDVNLPEVEIIGLNIN